MCGLGGGGISWCLCVHSLHEYEEESSQEVYREGKNCEKRQRERERRKEREDWEMIAQITGYRLMSCQILLLTCQ